MPRSGYEDVVLLTGFPSFLANRLLFQVVRSEPRTLVYAVVRPDAAQEAGEVLSGLAQGERDRIVLMEGDAAAMDLGLSGAEFGTLAREVDRIHHLAHASYLGLDRRECERLNVGGVGEILEVAAACRSLRCLVLHSTAQVAGDRRGLVREEELEANQRFPTLIAETRARGEKLARAAMSRLPIAVVRPGTIIGDSQTGEIDRLDGPYLFILLILGSPPDLPIFLPGRGDAPLHMVPVDYVIRAAHAIGLDPRAPGRTFHLVDPSPLPARRVFELVAEAAARPLPRGSFPTNLARALLRTPGLERFAKSPRAFVDQLATDVRFDARNTEAILAGTGVECPPFDSYVSRIVDYVRERRERAATRTQPSSAPPAVEDRPSPSIDPVGAAGQQSCPRVSSAGDQAHWIDPKPSGGSPGGSASAGAPADDKAPLAESQPSLPGAAGDTPMQQARTDTPAHSSGILPSLGQTQRPERHEDEGQSDRRPPSC